MSVRSDVFSILKDLMSNATIRFRQGTAVQWTASNRVLRDGEPGYETDTGKFKLGRSGLPWNSLPYAGSGSSGGASGLDESQVTGLINTAVSNAMAAEVLRANSAYSTPAGLSMGLDTKPNFVIVIDGTEVRPSGPLCIWVGGSEKPINMQVQDVHLAEEPADVTAPTTPTGLAVSAVTTTGFTVSWTPSSDAVGVTGYEIRLNGGTAITKTSNSHTFTTLAENTTYTVEVRARDAAGNFSPWASLSAATLAPNVMRNFFAPAYMTEMKSQPDWSPTVANDPGGIELASIFWSAGSGAKPFMVHGVRLYTPSTADSAYMNGNVTARLYAREYVSDPVDVSSFPTLNSEATKSATYSTPRTPDSWVDILFDSPVQINPAVGGVQDPGDDLAVVSIQMDSGSYMAVSFAEIDAFLAAHSTTPGNSGAMINSPHGDSVKWPASALRTAFQQATNNWTPGTNWYGVDLIYTVVN